ncbi:tyrosine-type recombinase/integrase [Sphingomonas sanxanigenens]|uniref:Tyr recombinase domain-containing protein n=1 Tax=Sphingomonas sanxanigenens DSM 19645 = NX02 TaxID=1123269 RepID=W0AAA8_9SPHN|nr:site-specific integrase [Sphingomonas sanxanigenens]AHE52590.1 hypothetical protein NX02_04210 [Sphingomonas sanxanigenens DSM 19645 = NX02]
MSVYRSKNSPYWQYDFVIKGRRFYGSTGKAKKSEALIVEAQERAKAKEPPNKREPITVDDAAGLYQDHAETQPSWPTTRYMLNDMVKGLGKSRFLSEVSQIDIQRYFAKRRSTRSNATINREVEVCRAMWRRAAKARFDVGEMPDWRALMLRVPKKAPRELSLEEEPRLFAEIRADLVDVCDFALKSGWRRSEVLGLRWADCDFTTMQATTRIKGGDVVRRPLTATLIAIIKNQPKAGAFVFTYVCQKSREKRRKGERYPMTATAIRGVWAAAKAAAAIEGFRFHDLRHTRGTRIVRATGSLAAAQKALQHTNIKTTLRYAHVLDEDVRNALDESESRNIPEIPSSERKKA